MRWLKRKKHYSTELDFDEIHWHSSIPNEAIGYMVKPIELQVEILTRHFPHLRAKKAIKIARSLPQLPEGAKGWFAIPRWQKIASSYSLATKRTLAILTDVLDGKFYNSNLDLLNDSHFRQTQLTESCMEEIAARQKSDILIIPAQTAPEEVAYGEYSEYRYWLHRWIFQQNEFGLGTYAVAMIFITLPKILTAYEPAHSYAPIGCFGDECDQWLSGDFSSKVYFDHKDWDGWWKISIADDLQHFHTASAFLID